MVVSVEQGKKGINETAAGDVVTVPFSVIHKCRRFKGHVAVPNDGCVKSASIIWEKEEPKVSADRLETLKTNLVSAALGTDNTCRFQKCPQRRIRG
ncbi:MAG: hypothetical protein ACHQ0Y_04970 [Thermodesulfovibrionales bacterium]